MNINNEQDAINFIHRNISREERDIIEDLTKIIGLFSSRSSLVNYYLGMYYQKRDKNKAIKFFTKSYDLDPNFSVVVFEIAAHNLELENESVEKDRQIKLATEENIGKKVYKDFIKSERPFFKKAETLLMTIFGVPLADYTTPDRRKIYNLESDLRISSILCPIYMADRNFVKVEKIYMSILKEYTKLKPEEVKSKQNYMICWKNIHIDLGQIYFHQNKFDEAYKIYADGFKYGLGLDKNHDFDLISNGATTNNEKNNYLINKYLLEACMLTRHYMSSWPSLPIQVNDIYDLLYDQNYKKDSESKEIKDIFYNNGPNKFYSLNFRSSFAEKSTNGKIRIGYISPDFNKNAVGLFISPLMKYYNPEKFEIYSYYTNASQDEYTFLFRRYNTRWTSTNGLDSQQIANLIIDHGIDILVDLIGHGHGNTMEVLKLLEYEKNKPIIVTYLGYPDTTMLRSVDYRLVDYITDHIKSKDITEDLIKMPRCFICYHPFENEEIPKIDYYRNRPGYINDGKVRIGILNKGSKHSPAVLKDWKYILESCKNCILVIKLDQHSEFQKGLYKDLPQNQLEFLPFMDYLTGYYDIYNNIDFCIDTYPYSGTTSTCSSLFMGVHTFAKYDPNDGSKRHVSNVSASILLNAGLQDFVCKNSTIYKKTIVDYINNFNDSTDSTQKRLELRKQFFESMDPKKFMEEYENEMTKIYNKKLLGI